MRWNDRIDQIDLTRVGEIQIGFLFLPLECHFFCKNFVDPQQDDEKTTMKVVSTNNVKVYTVSGEAVRSLPDWLVRQKKRALRDDPGLTLSSSQLTSRLSLTGRVNTRL